MAAGAAAAAGMTAGKFAAQLGAQLGADAVSKTSNTLIDRMFAKRDRNINWKESERYGKRNMQWAKDMAQFNENISMRLAQHDQRMAKDYFDYTLEQDSPAQQMKRLKEAGLNPALMYDTGSAGATGQTGGAAADPVRANAPEENYKPIAMAGSSAMAIRETAAERELKLAQAEDLKSQVKEREGVKKTYTETLTRSIEEGITSDKARTALVNAQRVAVELENRITKASEEDTIDIVRWSARKSMKEFEIANDEAYISSQTREEKIGILRQTLINSVIEANLKRAVIKHTGKQDEQIDATIREIANRITDRVHSWTQWEKDYRLDQLKVEIDKEKLELEKEMSKYVGLDKLGGKIFDKAIESIYKSAGIIDQLLGFTPDKWR